MSLIFPSPIRSGFITFLIIAIPAFFMLTFCSREYKAVNTGTGTTYTNVDLHFDAARSESLDVPFDAHYTSSGELFTGTQKIYYTENDSLHMELYFEEGINTGSIQYQDGDIYKIISGRYQGKPHFREMYINDILVYKDVTPVESENGMGHLRLWHKNGQLSVEVSYSGDRVYQGLMREYDMNGKLIGKERYEDGKMVDKLK